MFSEKHQHLTKVQTHIELTRDQTRGITYAEKHFSAHRKPHDKLLDASANQISTHGILPTSQLVPLQAQLFWRQVAVDNYFLSLQGTVLI